MKALFLVIVSMAAALAVQGQGYFEFGNANGVFETLAIGITGNPGTGNDGDYFGSTFNASLYYSLTPISSKVDPATLILYAPATAAFFGTTGPAPNHGPEVDGAGLFDVGTVTIPGTVNGQVIYVEVAVWYAGAGATSYASATALGYQTGYAPPEPVTLATPPVVEQYLNLPALTIQLIPEPSTIALGALSCAALLIFRRRK